MALVRVNITFASFHLLFYINETLAIPEIFHHKLTFVFDKLFRSPRDDILPFVDLLVILVLQRIPLQSSKISWTTSKMLINDKPIHNPKAPPISETNAEA